MSGVLKITGERPLAAKRIIDILGSGPKTAILRILNDKGALTAKEIASELGVKIPTVLSHLNDLVKAGLVTVDYDGRVKKYRLTARRIVVEIDLPLYLHLTERISEEELKEIEALTARYIMIKRRGSGLPLTITVKDVAESLGVDRSTAIEIVDYINTRTEDFIELLAKDALEILRRRGELTIRELANELNIHVYWAALTAQHMVSKGFALIKGDRVTMQG